MKIQPIIFVAILLVLAMSVTPLVSAINITSCGEINVSGNYDIVNDLSINASAFPPCLDIVANDVHINGNGYTITELSGAVSNVAIQVVDFSNFSLTNTIIDDSWFYGLAVTSDDAVINNVIAETGGQIESINSGLTITNSTFGAVPSSGEPAILVTCATTCTLTGNNFYDSGSGATGTFSSYGEVATTNIVLNNNYIENPSGQAINLFTFTNPLNSLTLNGNVLNETISTSTYFSNSVSVDSNTYTNPTRTGHSDNCTNDGSGFCVEDYTFSTSPLAIDSNPVSLSELNDFLINSCKPITESGYYTLTNNINNSGSLDCLYSNVSDIVYDCQGYTITSDFGGIAVQSEESSGTADNVTITNCVFEGDTATSVYFGGSSSSTNVNIYNNTFNNATYASLYFQTNINNLLSYDNSFNNNLGLFMQINNAVVDMAFYDNVFNSTNNSIAFSGSPTVNVSFSQNAWTNPSSTGFSDTCINDGFGICEEDYNVSTAYGLIDYDPVALSSPCTTIWECVGYGASTCLIDDTTTASCNAVNDTNACGSTYTGDYTEFANETGVCDYCTPDFYCDGYYNSSCIIFNGTGTSTYSCNSVADNNSCYSTTLLPSDQFIGNPADYGSGVISCDADFYTNSAYGFSVLVALIPVMMIIGLFLSSGIARKYFKKSETTSTWIGVAVTTIMVLLLIALL